jgi:hypothetical protein
MSDKPERWRGICSLLQEKNWPVFHNSVDVETILALAEELGASEAKLATAESLVRELARALQHLRNEAHGFISMCDPNLHGYTNIRVMHNKLDEADAALSKIPKELLPKDHGNTAPTQDDTQSRGIPFRRS